MAKYKIIPSSRTIVQSPISIGHKAEKGVEAIEFDLTAWVETYGSGTLTVIMRRWGDAIPYPIALEIDENNKATWTLSDIDTAKAGMAYAQLSYTVGDEVVKKSDIYTFRVMDSLTGEGEPPEAYDSWLEHLTHLAAEAMAEVLDIEGIVTDKTLTVDGGVADGKATGDALALKADKSTTYTKTEVDQMIEDVEVETDTTLSVSGAPADAKKTGDEIAAVKADLDTVDYRIEQATSDEQNVDYTTTAGYITTSGGHKSASSTNLEIYTNNIPVTAGEVLRIHEVHANSHDLWLVYAYYDANGNFVRPRKTIEPEGGDAKSEIDIALTIENTGFIAFSYRTYGDSTLTISKKTPIGKNSEKISELANVAVFGQYHTVRAVNHRGYNDEVENTLPAYILSKKNGFDYVETDVRFTSDGIPVLLHDASLNRTGTNADGTSISGTVNIADITYSDAITNYKIGNGAIPKFEDFIALCRSLGLYPYIELKVGTAEQIAGLVSIVKRFGMLRKVSWISDALSLLGYVTAVDSNARIAPILQSYGSNVINNLLPYRTNGAEIFLDLRYDRVSDYLTGAMTNDIPIEVWGITTESQIIAMDSYVSGVTTDRYKAWEVLGRSYLVN